MRRIRPHGAKLEQHEGALVASDPCLAEDRQSGVQIPERKDRDQQRERHHEPANGEDEIKNPRHDSSFSSTARQGSSADTSRGGVPLWIHL